MMNDLLLKQLKLNDKSKKKNKNKNKQTNKQTNSEPSMILERTWH